MQVPQGASDWRVNCKHIFSNSFDIPINSFRPQVHNTMVNIMGGTKIDFDGLASTFNDPSWSRDNMQKYLQLIEHDLDPSASPSDHGFNGWLKTRGIPMDVFTERPQFFGPSLIFTGIEMQAKTPDQMHKSAIYPPDSLSWLLPLLTSMLLIRTAQKVSLLPVRLSMKTTSGRQSTRDSWL